MSHDSEPLQKTVHEHKLSCRHARIDLIEAHADVESQRTEARSLLRQLVMQRVFDRFSGAEEAVLLDRLWPLAHQGDDNKESPMFGEGAYNLWHRRGKQNTPGQPE